MNHSSRLGTETPALIMAAMVTTLEEQLLPHLIDPTARAAAESMLQVLTQLSTTVAWSPAPLARRLEVRRAALAAMPRTAAPNRPAPWCGAVDPTDAVALERAIHQCDAYVSELVAFGQGEAVPPLERWLLGYCRAAADVDLSFMAPSHLGKLTRETGPNVRPEESA
ncbi:hypothetical protein [Hydrogenophaga palleronii]|uniref:hypothetical protein n=1 Tax=Hydrogenophaga palleronii TaxID=65655 RepID=UPI0008264A27|nr:hypothetical protein [Hydrogenophaga palleronii]